MTVPYTFANKTGLIPLTELDANFEALDTAVPPLALAAGTVTQGTQANITSVGTLSSLTVSGFINGGTITGTQLIGTIATSSQPNITEIGALTSLTVNNVFTAGSILTTTIAGQLTTASQPSITSLGTLTSLSVTGNINSGNISASSITGTLQTSAQPSITSLGTLTSLSVAGNISGAQLAGTISTSAQPNITSLGTLSSLAVSGSATAPTAANGASNTQIATTAFVSNSLSNLLPTGVIVLWSGSTASVPAGWLLCDGNNGTPDLRDRFVVGAGSTYNPDATGGSADAIVVSHTHTANSSVTDPGHRHTYNAPSGTDDGGLSGSVVDNIVSANTGNATTGITVATTISSTGSSGTNANLPPYYALAYIMKA